MFSAPIKGDWGPIFHVKAIKYWILKDWGGACQVSCISLVRLTRGLETEVFAWPTSHHQHHHHHLQWCECGQYGRHQSLPCWLILHITSPADYNIVENVFSAFLCESWRKLFWEDSNFREYSEYPCRARVSSHLNIPRHLRAPGWGKYLALTGS